MYYLTRICLIVFMTGCIGAGQTSAQLIHNADFYEVSIQGGLGNYKKNYIFNNGHDDVGSIALKTSAGICLDVRPTGETKIMNGPNGDPTLHFHNPYGNNSLTGRIGSIGALAFYCNTSSAPQASSTPDLFIARSGDVAIGGDAPQGNKLFVNGNIRSEKDGVAAGMEANKNGIFMGSYTDNDFFIGANIPGKHYAMMVSRDNRRVQLGFDKGFQNVSAANEAKYGLFVMKGILSESFALAPGTAWADYVFEKEYRLSRLDSVEAYIQAKGHLPGIPSADAIERQGYDLHDMNRRFMEKIEELTLYVIDQQKVIERQQKEIEGLRQQEQRIAELAKQVERLEKMMGK